MEFLKKGNLPVENVLSKLENKIVYYINRYCIDDALTKRLDIFKSDFGNGYWSADQHELLPVVGYAMNKFTDSNKQKIINELVNAEPLIRSLKLLEYVTGEKERTSLFEVVRTANVESYIKLYKPFTYVQFILQTITELDGFQETAKKMFNHLETEIIKSKNEPSNDYLILAFRINLLLKYYDGSQEEIDNVQAPKFKYNNLVDGFSPDREKQFYKGLCRLNVDDHEQAYEIFNGLLQTSGNEKPAYALNRFASKIKWGDKEEEIVCKMRLYKESIDEWIDFENKLDKNTSIEYLKENIWHNKLDVYSKLENDSDFDTIYYKLEYTTQLKKEFLKLRVSNLVNRKMHSQAEKLLSKGETYHRLSNGQLPKFIGELSQIINIEDNIHFLREQYLRIFSKSPEELIRILPQNINGQTTLPEFILRELSFASDKMLQLINSISSVKDEDKYSDLLVLALNSRIQQYGWHTTTSRGGHSGSEKLNPGEIDFAVFTGMERLTVCEAIVMMGKNNTTLQTHAFKIFNYDHSRKFFFLIIYYKGPTNRFSHYWEVYQESILDEINFPEHFVLTKETFEDISMEFGNDCIKVAKGIHGINTILFHLFIT